MLLPTAAALGAAGLAAVGVAIAGWVRVALMVTDVVGPSMLPTYRDGDRLLARRRTRLTRLRPGQVVVLRNPRPAGVPGSSESPWLVKRVAAVAAQPVPYADAGTVVPPGHVVVLGDNPEQSLDSRQFGYVPLTHVVATVRRRMAGPARTPPEAMTDL